MLSIRHSLKPEEAESINSHEDRMIVIRAMLQSPTWGVHEKKPCSVAGLESLETWGKPALYKDLKCALGLCRESIHMEKYKASLILPSNKDNCNYRKHILASSKSVSSQSRLPDMASHWSLPVSAIWKHDISARDCHNHVEVDCSRQIASAMLFFEASFGISCVTGLDIWWWTLLFRDHCRG